MRRRTLDACQILAQRRAELLPAEDLNEAALATLAYCQWLSEQTGRPYRLPTEAQLE